MDIARIANLSDLELPVSCGAVILAFLVAAATMINQLI